MGCNVLRVDQLSFLPLQFGEIGTDEKTQISMLERLVSEKAYYFSYEYNLSKSCQEILKEASGEVEEVKGETEEGFWAKYNTNYIMNRSQLSLTKMDQFPEFFVPVIFGYVYIHSVQLDTKKFEYVLVSRKDVRRLGRRFVCRGLDREGNAANFVETE